MTETAIGPGVAIAEPTNGWWGNLVKMAMQYGFGAGLAVVLLWYIAVKVIEPMQADQKRFMDSVITVNAENAKTMAKQTDIQQQQAAAMTQIVPLLQQIRDDQRRGVWKEAP